MKVKYVYLVQAYIIYIYICLWGVEVEVCGSADIPPTFNGAVYRSCFERGSIHSHPTSGLMPLLVVFSTTGTGVACLPRVYVLVRVGYVIKTYLGIADSTVRTYSNW